MRRRRLLNPVAAMGFAWVVGWTFVPPNSVYGGPISLGSAVGFRAHARSSSVQWDLNEVSTPFDFQLSGIADLAVSDVVTVTNPLGGVVTASGDVRAAWDDDTAGRLTFTTAMTGAGAVAYGPGRDDSAHLVPAHQSSHAQWDQVFYNPGAGLFAHEFFLNEEATYRIDWETSGGKTGVNSSPILSAVSFAMSFGNGGLVDFRHFAFNDSGSTELVLAANQTYLATYSLANSSAAFFEPGSLVTNADIQWSLLGTSSNPVPEPASAILFTSGMLLLCIPRRMRHC